LSDMNSRALYQTPAISLAAANLAGQPSHVSAPLKKQLVAIDAALVSARPDAACRLRRLVDSVSYIESMSGRPADAALAQIREFASDLIKTHAVK